MRLNPSQNSSYLKTIKIKVPPNPVNYLQSQTITSNNPVNPLVFPITPVVFQPQSYKYTETNHWNVVVRTSNPYSRISGGTYQPRLFNQAKIACNINRIQGISDKRWWMKTRTSVLPSWYWQQEQNILAARAYIHVYLHRSTVELV